MKCHRLNRLSGHFVIVLVGLCGISLALPSGAPHDACYTLSPQHGDNSGSSRQSPFIITASAKTYSGGNPIQVTIQSQTGKPFKGYIVRPEDEFGQPLIGGEWHEGKESKMTDDVDKLCITHTNSAAKSKIVLTYYPPAGKGTVRFSGSVVENYRKFYTNIRATVISSRPLSQSSSSLSGLRGNHGIRVRPQTNVNHEHHEEQQHAFPQQQHADHQSFDDSSHVQFPEQPENSAQLIRHQPQPQSIFDSGVHQSAPQVIHQQQNQPQVPRGPPGRPLIKPNRRPAPPPPPPVQVEDEQIFDDEELHDDLFDLPLHQMQQQVQAASFVHPIRPAVERPHPPRLFYLRVPSQRIIRQPTF